MSDDPQSDSTPPAEANPARFEKALAELEQLVEQLESGDLSLEDCLAQFERGVTLARECRESLTAAEQKIQILLEREGEGDQLADFQAQPEAEPDSGANPENGAS